MDEVPERSTCSTCGATVSGEPPLTWSVGTGPRGRTLTCVLCTREHVRSIEAKLDEQWW